MCWMLKGRLAPLGIWWCRALRNAKCALSTTLTHEDRQIIITASILCGQAVTAIVVPIILIKRFRASSFVCGSVCVFLLSKKADRKCGRPPCDNDSWAVWESKRPYPCLHARTWKLFKFSERQSWAKCVALTTKNKRREKSEKATS